ncbi:hypothetical protein NQZ68_020371 [Dissostichus eleginoides]|nr:hypothetical protein NQZ68_020371 [Dissostichus eleginoides]
MSEGMDQILWKCCLRLAAIRSGVREFPEPVSGKARLRRVAGRRDMGARAEPMQRVVARLRQNTGKQQD